MTRNGRVFAPKYTPKVFSVTVPTPQAGAYVCIPTTLVGAPDLLKGTSGSLV